MLRILIYNQQLNSSLVSLLEDTEKLFTDSSQRLGSQLQVLTQDHSGPFLWIWWELVLSWKKENFKGVMDVLAFSLVYRNEFTKC